MTSERLLKKRKLQHLLQVSALEESGASGLALNAIIVTAVVVLLVILWAAIAPMQEVSQAPGVVIPQGEIAKVQHLEGGLVSAVYVKNGDRVHKGTILLSLSPVTVEAELKRLRSRQMALEIDCTRLRYLMSGEELTEAQLVASANPKTNEEINTADILAGDALRLYTEQENVFENQIDVLDKTIARLDQEAKNSDTRVEELKGQIDLAEEERTIMQKLWATRSVSRLQWLQTEEKYQSLKSDLAQSQGKKEQALLSMQEAQANMSEASAKFKEAQSEKLSEYTADLLDVESNLAQYNDKKVRLSVVSPVNGIVNNVILDPGTVVAPGSVLAEVVPMDEELVIEARVSPKDIGFVKTKNLVRIKVTAFDPARFGSLIGVVESLSPATFLDENKKPYYKAIIQLKNERGESHRLAQHLIPGMTVSADIITGEKSLLAYLLKPIAMSFEMAFTER